ncbi:hypothetical protein MRB53_004156 [Persea americana]|uniref:Uncharacterized protein n=1 Tax=Persea americana TaxID=3435 RepID=A0ACC2N0A1_PERAE|nr:hypothetical protein MRB53_004156 [Persea americana]
MARFLSLSSYLLVLMMLLLADLHLFASSPAHPPVAPPSPTRASTPVPTPHAPPSMPTPAGPPRAPTPHTPPSMPTPSAGPPRAPTSEPNHDGKSGDSTSGGGSSGGLKSGQKAGIAIGVILGAGIIGFAGFVYKKRKANIRRARFGSAARRAQL